MEAFIIPLFVFGIAFYSQISERLTKIEKHLGIHVELTAAQKKTQRRQSITGALVGIFFVLAAMMLAFWWVYQPAPTP